MPNRIVAAQECDATDDASSTTADKQNKKKTLLQRLYIKILLV